MERTHMTHLDKELHSFAGWKVAIQRMGHSFVRYFSSREYGGEEAACREAERVRDAILSALEQRPNEVEAIFSRFRKVPLDRPAGLREPKLGLGEAPATCTLRCQGLEAALLNRVCRRFHVDRSAALRLSLYALAAMLEGEVLRTKDLKQVVAHLEGQRAEWMPSWETYVGKAFK